MKKYVSLLAVVALVMFMVLPAFADTMTRLNENSDVKTLVLINTAANPVVFNVNATASNANSLTTPSIVPGMHRIISASVTPLVSGAGQVSIALFDNITIANSTLPATQASVYGTGMFAEKMGANTATTNIVLSYPKKLANGLSVFAGGASVTTIEYEVYQY
jgi:hypothetical protein